MRQLYVTMMLLSLVFASPALAGDTAVQPLPVDRIAALVLENNPALVAAQAGIGASEEALKASRADRLPTLEMAYSYTGLRNAPVMKTMGQEIPIAHGTLYSWHARIIQPLFTGFALSTQVGMARLEAAVSRLEKEQAELDLTLAARASCYQFLLAQKLSGVAQDAVHSLEGHVKDAEQYYRHGLIPKNDMLESSVALAAARQRLALAQANEQKTATRINRLLNRPLETPLVVMEIQTPPERALEPRTMGGQALKTRPVLRALDLGLEKMGLTEKLAKSRWYPEVAMVGQYEQTGDNPEATYNAHSNTNNTSIRIQAEWTLWNWGKTRAQAARARYGIQAVKARIETLRNQILEEVHTASIDCRVARKNIDTAKAVLDQAKENWRITNAQYRQHVVTSTQVLDARTYLSRADSDYFQALYGYMSALAALDRAVGEGLEATTENQQPKEAQSCP